MKGFYSIILFFISSFSFTQDTLSVLMIGNSYTYFNNLPNMFENLSSSLGKHASVESQTNGGYTFELHANNSLTYQKINSKNWDYVLIQGQSQEPSFPWGQVNTQTLPYAVQIADSVHQNYTCSQAMYFMTWGRENGDPQWDSINTFNKMNLRLRNAYLRFADSSNSSVSPVGIAWKYVRDNHPTISLYTNDGSHPSLEGSYLAACTHYSSMYHSSPVGAAYTAGIDSSIASLLQQAAAISVLDSLSTWRLLHHDSLTQVGFNSNLIQANEIQFIQTTQNVDSVTWYFGDGSSSHASNPTHIYNQNDTFNITLVGYGPCGIDSAQQQVIIENTSNLPFNGTQKFILKTHKPNEYTIESVKEHSIELRNNLGQEIDFTTIYSNGKQTRFSLKNKGLFYLITTTGSEKRCFRIINY